MEFKAKRRILGAFCLLGAILIFGAIFYACTNDFGVEADFFKGSIKGEVVLNSLVPENTDEIRIAVTKSFPPSDILGLIFSGPLPVKKDSTLTAQTVAFDLQVPLGEYEAAFAIWKELDESFNPADIIGLYGNLQLSQPIPISVTQDTPTVENVDIDIDFGKVMRNSKIEGRITFVGDWPANTGAVAIFVFPIVPKVIPDDFLTFAAFEELPQNVETFDYRVRISSGLYKYIAVFWLAEGDDLTNFKTLGFYRNPDAPEEPGEVMLETDQTVTGIDITADFANIK
ncbi:MAG: hypothetical protein ACE5HO_18600 [bacterium]